MNYYAYHQRQSLLASISLHRCYYIAKSICQICKMYLQGGQCTQKSCIDRHPKTCKWLKSNSGCKRQNCDYLHVTLVGDDDKQIEEHKHFPCAGCKNVFDDKDCVIQHVVQNTAFVLCLNCEDWIQFKERVIAPGWSLFDHNGDLRADV